MSNNWTDDKTKFISNFLVNSPNGIVFIESFDNSAICKNGEELFRSLNSMVQKISEENVTQMISDGPLVLSMQVQC